MTLRFVWMIVLGTGLSGAVHAQTTDIYRVELEAKGTLKVAAAEPGADGTRTLALDADDIVRRAGFDTRTHVLAVAGNADAMDLLIWDKRQARDAPGSAAAAVGSLVLNNKLRLSRDDRSRTIDLATISLFLGAVAGSDSITMGSTGIGRVLGNDAGPVSVDPATEADTGSLGTLELCSAGTCARGYLTTVNIRIGFRRSLGYTEVSVPDSDGDGYPDDVDQCPGAADEGYGVDSFGCPIPGNQDSDGDGVPDSQDSCPGQGDVGYGVDANGCPNVDSDYDGVYDAIDFCPDRGEEGYGVDPNGCPNPPAPQDYDGDGVTDDIDACFAEGDTYGYGVYPNGCPIMDSDGDGYADPYDNCPLDGDQGYGVDGGGCPLPAGE